MKDNLAISINNVTKYYSKKVLDGISLDVHQGDIFGILGGFRMAHFVFLFKVSSDKDLLNNIIYLFKGVN